MARMALKPSLRYGLAGNDDSVVTPFLLHVVVVELNESKNDPIYKIATKWIQTWNKRNSKQSKYKAVKDCKTRG